ncbi:MAG: pyrroline-5-carboxylate reductase [Eubacteriales bacterium]|nr:pyrroline-5-carboxylate reductase [Clostridiales bacterium]
MKNIAFLGVGNMAGAIIGGLAGKSDLQISLYDTNPAQYARFEGQGYTCHSTAAEAVAWADYIVLSVKPQNFAELAGMIGSVPTAGKVFISIMAGVSIARITELLGNGAAVIRTMPNAPLMIGMGVTALTRNEPVSDHDFEFALGIFSSLGEVLVVDESQMNAIIGVTASAPAYVYSLIRAIYDGAAEQGIAPAEMLDIICSMVEGSAKMLRMSGKTPDEMIGLVASKGGTTEAALAVLRERGFEEALRAAMAACTRRADELSAM